MPKNNSSLPEFGSSDLDALLQGSDRPAEAREQPSARRTRLPGPGKQSTAPQTVNRLNNPTEIASSINSKVRGRRREIIRIKRHLSTLRETLTEPVGRDVMSLGEQLKKCSQRDMERSLDLIAQLGATQAISAVDVLSDSLDSKIPSVRIAAVRSLAELPFARASLSLAEFLSDEFPADLRMAAFAGIARHFAIELLSPLLNLASTSALYLGAFRDAIALLDDESKEQIYGRFKESWWSDDVELAVTAVRLCSGCELPRMLEDFAELLQHENPRVRCAAVDCLAAAKQKKSVWLLNRAFADTVEEVRLCAIRGMIRHHSLGSIDRLLDACVDESLLVRREAASTLARIAVSDLFEKKTATAKAMNHQCELLRKLSNVLHSADDRVVKRSCLETVGQFQLEGAAVILEPYLEDSDTEIQNTACIAICRSCTRSSSCVLRALLTHVDASVRLQAVDAVARLNVRNLLPDIQVTASSDFSADVRAGAIRCLGKIGGSKSLKTLQEALNETGAVQCQAIIALGRTGVREAVPLVRQQLQDVRPEVCTLACAALAELGAKETIPLLLELSERSDKQIQRAALAALKKLGYQKSWLSGLQRKYVVPAARTVRSAIPSAAFLLADKKSLFCSLFIVIFGVAFSVWRNDSDTRAAQVVAISSVRDLHADLDGKTLLILRKFGVADLWEGDTGKLLARTTNVPKSAWRCLMVGNKALLVANSDIFIWDWKKDPLGNALEEVKRPDASSPVIEVTVAFSANRFATLNAEGVFVAYNATSLSAETEINTGIKGCKDFVLNEAADWFCIVTQRLEIAVFDVRTAKLLESLPLSALSEDAGRALDVHVAFRRSDAAMLVAPDTGAISIVDIAGGNLTGQIHRESKGCLVAAGFGDDNNVRMIDSAGNLNAFRISDGQLIESTPLAFSESITFTSDINEARRILIGSEESREAALFDAISGKMELAVSE